MDKEWRLDDISSYPTVFVDEAELRELQAAARQERRITTEDWYCVNLLARESAMCTGVIEVTSSDQISLRGAIAGFNKKIRKLKEPLRTKLLMSEEHLFLQMYGLPTEDGRPPDTRRRGTVIHGLACYELATGKTPAYGTAGPTFSFLEALSSVIISRCAAAADAGTPRGECLRHSWRVEGLVDELYRSLGSECREHTLSLSRELIAHARDVYQRASVATAGRSST